MAGTFSAGVQAVKRGLKQAWEVVEDAAREFSEDGGPLISAALAFHTLLSLAPLVIIAVAVASMVLEEGAAQAEVQRLMRQAMGPKVATTIRGWVEQASKSSELASVLGIGLVLFAASRLGESLREALNRTLNVQPQQTTGFRGAVRGLVQRRLFAFGIALASGPLLVLIFASRALLTRFHSILLPQSDWAAEALQVSQLLFAVAVVALGSALVLRFVPDEPVPTRRALAGGLLISLLFNVGNMVFGLYLGRPNVGAAYGLASSAVVVLLWLHFSSTVFLFSCEILQAYGRLKDKQGEEANKASTPKGSAGEESKTGPEEQRDLPSGEAPSVRLG